MKVVRRQSGSLAEPERANLPQEKAQQQSGMRGTEHSAKGVDAPRRLRRAGLRPTRQRVALAALLFGSGDRHVTAELLHEEAVKSGERVSLATVYNTLHQFKRAGLLREIAIGGQRAYFDTNTSNHNHFFVEAEGRLVDIPGESIRVDGVPEPPSDMKISHIDVVVRLVSK
jgi:Fur family transcriptional regulator, iron response regulator